MNVGFRSYRNGQNTGTLCLPCSENLASEKVERDHPDWKMVSCPVCGRDCYISPERQALLSENPGMKAACTNCVVTGRA